MHTFNHRLYKNSICRQACVYVRYVITYFYNAKPLKFNRFICTLWRLFFEGYNDFVAKIYYMVHLRDVKNKNMVMLCRWIFLWIISVIHVHEMCMLYMWRCCTVDVLGITTYAGKNRLFRACINMIVNSDQKVILSISF